MHLVTIRGADLPSPRLDAPRDFIYLCVLLPRLAPGKVRFFFLYLFLFLPCGATDYCLLSQTAATIVAAVAEWLFAFACRSCSGMDIFLPIQWTIVCALYLLRLLLQRRKNGYPPSPAGSAAEWIVSFQSSACGG